MLELIGRSWGTDKGVPVGMGLGGGGGGSDGERAAVLVTGQSQG